MICQNALDPVGPPGSRNDFVAERQTGKVVPPPAPFSEAWGSDVTHPGPTGPRSFHALISYAIYRPDDRLDYIKLSLLSLQALLVCDLEKWRTKYETSGKYNRLRKCQAPDCNGTFAILNGSARSHVSTCAILEIFLIILHILIFAID